MRFFNTAGPVECGRHYCIPPLERLDLEQVLMLIDQWKYFVIHAPRQTGKTTCLLALREYGLGRMRTDLLVLWPVPGSRETQKIVLELKLLRDSLDRTVSDGLAQTVEYIDRGGTREGHLVLFDRTPGRPWEEKVFRLEESRAGHDITVWGM